MDDIFKHKLKFNEIITKYNLDKGEKAAEIAKYLTGSKKIINAKEFATLFAMSEDDALVFLSFIEKGIKFKEETLDKK